MKILVISDTHIPVTADQLPETILSALKNCDLCVHAGDFIDYSVFKELTSRVETIGVCGNMDNVSVRKQLPEKQIITAEDVRLGLIHGRGAPDNLPLYVRDRFDEEWDDLDGVIFGHSHKPFNKTIEGKLFFNPGSAMDKVFADYNSYGILDIHGHKINAEIIKIS